MFWGLIMDSNKKYSQVIEKSFHISMASLDVNKASNETVQVSASFEGTSYLLCTLSKGTVWQQPLDLNFEVGKSVSFSCNGNGRVHLTGYIVEEEDDDFFDENCEADSDEEIPELVPMEKKRKSNPTKNDKTGKAKKSKLDVSLPDESDSDDADYDILEGMDAQNDVESSDDDEDDDVEEGEDDDDEDDDDEDNEEDDEDDEDEDEDVEEEKAKVTKKTVKNEVMTNGKDAKLSKAENKHKKNKEKKDNSKTEEKSEPQQQQKKRVIEGGVQIEDIRQGHGTPAKQGKFISVYYVGRLKNGKKFDQTTSGEGFKFRLGKGEVIRGWDAGIVGMKVGGKRRITIPPNMGYGAKGSPPVIPPNSQLIFEVELKSVN